ncbi:uncharacterized protein V6R79_019260 [Siganus canaliculatus]
MGKVNVCLKRSYIIVTSLIAVISALLLALTLFSHGYFHEDDEIEKMITGIHTFYVFSIITIVLTIIGIYGAFKKKQWALIAFAVVMIFSSLFLLAMGIILLVALPQISETMKIMYLDMLPLTNASEQFVDGFKELQKELQCCGLNQGYLDWGYNISESCLCTEESINPCVAAPRNSSLFEHVMDDQPIMIYKDSCLPYIIMHEMTVINSTAGVLLGLLLLWVLSVVLCIMILCQLNRKEDTPTVVYSPEAKAGNYIVLTDSPEYT